MAQPAAVIRFSAHNSKQILHRAFHMQGARENFREAWICRLRLRFHLMFENRNVFLDEKCSIDTKAASRSRSSAPQRVRSRPPVACNISAPLCQCTAPTSVHLQGRFDGISFIAFPPRHRAIGITLSIALLRDTTQQVPAVCKHPISARWPDERRPARALESVGAESHRSRRRPSAEHG